MKNVQFTYQGKSYQGLLAISHGEYPHFYWFYPDDPRLARAVNECLSFKVEPGAPLAFTEPCPPEVAELAAAIRAAVEPYRAVYSVDKIAP